MSIFSCCYESVSIRCMALSKSVILSLEQFCTICSDVIESTKSDPESTVQVRVEPDRSYDSAFTI